MYDCFSTCFSMWGESRYIFCDKFPRQVDPYVFRCAEPIIDGVGVSPTLHTFIAHQLNSSIRTDFGVEIHMLHMGEQKTNTENSGNMQRLLQQCLKAMKLHRCFQNYHI